MAAIAFSPDSERLFTVNDDAAWDWPLTGGQPQRSFSAPPLSTNGWRDPKVNAVAVSPDGHRILTGLADQRALLWDADTGALLHTFASSNAVLAVAFSPDGKQFLTGGYSDGVNRFDLATGRVIRSYNDSPSVQFAVSSVAMSLDGQSVVAGQWDGTARVWETASGQLRGTFRGHTNLLTVAAISSDGKQLLTGGSEQTVRLWDINTGQLIRLIHDGPAVAFSASGQHFLSGTQAGVVHLWETGSGRLLRSFSGIDHPISAVAFAPNGKLIGVASIQGDTRLWPVQGIAGDLRITRAALGAEIRWHEGVLQESPTSSGPWRDLTEAASPYPVGSLASVKFYRLLLSP